MKSRRDFLQKLTVGAGILPFAFSFTPNENPMNIFDDVQDGPILRVAIMGLGSYGNRVAEAMMDCKRAKITGVISGTPSKIKEWQANQEPKMREFELKMLEWEAAHQPKMEEFQRKMEAWQKEHQLKLNEFQKLLQEEFQKGKEKN